MRNMLSLILVLFFSIAWCSSDQTDPTEIIGVDKIIHNKTPKWGDSLKVALKFIQKIGVIEGNDTNYQLFRPNDVFRDNNGNIYITDEENHRIQKFNKSGRYLLTIGRTGQGPGDLIRPTNIDLDSLSNIYVNDSGNSRIHIFSSDGKYLNIIRLQQKILNFRLQNKMNRLIVQPAFAFFPQANKSIPNWSPKLLALADNKGNFLKRFGTTKQFKDILTNEKGNFISFDVDVEGNIYIVFWYQNLIEKYSSDGAILYKINRVLNYSLSVTEKMIDLPRQDRPVRIIDFTPISTKGLGIDYKQRLWVPTYKQQPDENYKYDPNIPYNLIELEIYDQNGKLLSKLPVDFYFNRFRIVKEYVYFIDSNYQMCIYEYNIVEK